MGLVRVSWEAKKEYLAASASTMRSIFTKLRLFVAFQQAQRRMRAAARKAKRRRMLTVLEKAEDAASRGDSKMLYRCVSCEISVQSTWPGSS